MALAADADGRDVVATPLDPYPDVARAAHLDPLLADDLGRGVAFDQPVADEVAAERAAGAAGRGVFGDAHAGGEHAAVDGRARALDLAREDEDLGRDAVLVRDAFYQVRPGPRAPRRVERAQRHEEEGHAAGDDFERQT